ncbi:MAG: hypothetical protein K0M60_02445 [Hydrogenophaga sp.]|nr:hypothetical protein [Hydrogenophaga sp.]
MLAAASFVCAEHMAARHAAAGWVELASGNHAPAEAIVSFDCRLKQARLIGCTTS